MTNYYKILHTYDLHDTHLTLVIEAINKEEATGIDKNIFGTFHMNLLNADEVDLDAIGDKSFIDSIKQEEVFFVEIRKDYYQILSKGESVEGWIIVEPD